MIEYNNDDKIWLIFFIQFSLMYFVHVYTYIMAHLLCVNDKALYFYNVLILAIYELHRIKYICTYLTKILASFAYYSYNIKYNYIEIAIIKCVKYMYRLLFYVISQLFSIV